MWGTFQFQKTQGFCVADFATHLTKERRVRKLFYCLQSQQFMQAPKLQSSNAECGSLETDHKDSRQIFQYSKRMFEQILQISFKISFGA